MSDAEKLAALRIMVGDSDSDAVLNTYLDFAARKIIAKAYPYRTDVTEVPSQYDHLQVEIAVYMLNKRGAEGEMSHSENGISRTYEKADVPYSMLSEIVPHVGTFGSSTT